MKNHFTTYVVASGDGQNWVNNRGGEKTVSKCHFSALVTQPRIYVTLSIGLLSKKGRKQTALRQMVYNCEQLKNESPRFLRVKSFGALSMETFY